MTPDSRISDRRSKGSLWWGSLSVAHQVLVWSSLLVIVSFAGLGFWVSNEIERAIKVDAGVRAATYMVVELADHLQELERTSHLSPETARTLTEVLFEDMKHLDVAETRVWSLDGEVLYSSNPAHIGNHPVMEDDIRRAIGGETMVDFDRHPHEGEVASPGQESLFEIYTPIFGRTSGKVIAVAEFYQNGVGVISAVRAARFKTWVMTSLACIGLLAGVSFVLIKGDRLINGQRAALDQQVTALVELLGQNEDLRLRLEKASQRGTEVHEAVLRRIGADLHDGVGQLLAIMMLRLKHLFERSSDDNSEYSSIKSLLGESMSEIRHMAAGLALPEIKELSLSDAVNSVVKRHEYRTRTAVQVTIGEVPVEPGHAVRLGICRMIQEGLNNAFKHADGVGQSVRIDCGPSRIVVEIRDRGPGIRPKTEADTRQALGLTGIRSRVDSLGGALTIDTAPGKGTVLHALFSVTGGGGQRID